MWVPKRSVAAGLLTLATAASGAAALAQEPPLLVSYSFEDDIETGPDTVAVWQHAAGTVRLSEAFRVSGYRSLEIADVARDGTFPELQGYFPLLRHGRLYVHFAFLAVDVTQDLNIALAGPGHFTLQPDGMAFWLALKGGQLVHHPATRTLRPAALAAIGSCASKALLTPQPFVWYQVDVAYDVDAGLYDLTIRGEGAEAPLVELKRQRNAISRPGSAVSKFSFIGDLDDTGHATYYVDDIRIGTNAAISLTPFVAPGRRRLFVDSFAAYQRQQRVAGSCLPAVAAGDFGLAPSELRALREAGLEEMLAALLSDPTAATRLKPLALPAALPAAAMRKLEAARSWSAACAALPADPAAALAGFEAAAREVPGAVAYPLASALALARLGRWTEAGDRLDRVAALHGADARYGVAAAMVGVARGDLASAKATLRLEAESVPGRTPGPSADELRLAEQYYFVLLWNGDFAAAQDYAERMARTGGAAAGEASWLERAGDAAVRQARYGEARALYESSLRQEPGATWPLLKLSDVAFLQGDLAGERRLRETIYGRVSADPREP
jgi:hypothetical protein